MTYTSQRFTRNTRGRDLIVGDIHGCFTKLQQALTAIEFSPSDGDRLFCVGDMVDRGPESPMALEWLAQPWFHSVIGNHEQTCLGYLRGQIPAGYYARGFNGAWALSLSSNATALFIEAFDQLPVAIEIETELGIVGIVHADCPTRNWPEFIMRLADPKFEPRVDMAIWSRDRHDRPHESLPVENVRAVIVGHTPVERMQRIDNVLFIDSKAWANGGDSPREFTIIDADTLMMAGKRIDWESTASALER
jgi:serine/threonine protein phosphatase 1